MKQLSLIFSTLFIVFAISVGAQAATLCEQQIIQVTDKMRAFDSSESSKKALLTTYHNKITELRELCSYKKVSQLETQIKDLLQPKSRGLASESQYAFEPRKSVEIGTIHTVYSRSRTRR